MKYALAQVSNGNFSIASEHGENKQAAFVAFHQACANFWNSPDVITATLAVLDENLDVVEGKKEYISHPVPEPNEEQTD